MADKTMSVRVSSRQGLVFEGVARAVSSVNARGPFDILPDHANFVSTISRKLVILRNDGKKEEMNIDSGIMQVYQNRVLVFLGII